MIQEIKYGGYSTAPSDYECSDGDLALSLNLINEEGGLKPVRKPKDTGITISNGTLLCIHNTALFTHYIILSSDKKLKYIDASDSTHAQVDTGITITADITDAKCIGNTVCICTGVGVYHVLWTKNESQTAAYKNLSTKLPEARLSFGLKGNIVMSDNNFTASYTKRDNNSLSPKETSDINALTSPVLAAVNRLIKYVSNEGKFSMPFFVRYAYRLYDGSLTMQSAPILMLPTNNGCPIVFGNFSQASGQANLSLKAYAPSCALDYAFIGSVSDIEKYNDIIKSIDIFISAPIYSYNQDGRCEEVYNYINDDSFGIFAIDNNLDNKTSVSQLGSERITSIKKYSRRNILNTIKMCKDISINFDDESTFCSVKVPTRDEKLILDDFKKNANFYFLTSIPIDKLSTTRTALDITENDLNNLVTHESLPDDFCSHDTLSAQSLFSYNSRLIMSNVKRYMFPGYFQSTYAEKYVSYVINYETGVSQYMVEDSVEEHDCYTVNKVISHINKDGKDIVVEEDNISVDISSPTTARSIPRFHYFYHPDPNVYKVEICGTIGSGSASTLWSYIIKPSPNDTLNGSYYFDEFKRLSQVSSSSSTTDDGTLSQLPSDSVTQNTDGTWSATTEDFNFNNNTTPTQASNDTTISLPNRIYVSEVNNPFVFPAQSIVSVGSGSVIGVSTAAQALSQGQFGSFPLYAFTTDGVWALSVSNTGAFSAVQPITRDVCINAKSITQLDGSVLFATNRGIMLISGSNVQCLSDTINSENPFILSNTNLPKIEDLHAMVHSSSDKCIPIKAFSSFLSGCRMIYDYTHQHVIVYNPSYTNNVPNYTYAYVLSLKSMSWGMMYNSIAYDIDSYPDALAVSRANKLVSFSESDNAACKGMFVTRPLKLGGKDIFKSINSIYQRGYFQPSVIKNGTLTVGDVNTVLYGSRDMFNWYLIGSSKDGNIVRLHGTPYKYFRIAGVANLSEGKSVSGATIEVIPREMSKQH